MLNKKKEIENWFRYLRDLICQEYSNIELKKKFKKKRWNRKKKSLGGGEIAMLRDGETFEKVGVNISTVYGNLITNLQSKFQEHLRVTSSGLQEYQWLFIPRIQMCHHCILILDILRQAKAGSVVVWI